MKTTFHQSLASLVVLLLALSACTSNEEVRRISVEEYRSKMTAGWLGQMAGVGWGAPTEFRFNTTIIPEEQVPEWESGMINQQFQDDIYVEMTFLKTLEDHGFGVSIRQAGIDFANSEYMLWHANLFGRNNLRSGIAPPHSGHPKHNAHADDIDYQIEADFSGLISPGMPQMVIDLGNKFGRIMNYGDGVYGGQFVGAMYAEAFFEKDIQKIIKAGLACIPAESQYAEAILDVLRWHEENPDDWQKTWQLIENKYNLNPDYRKFSCNGTDPGFNIDAKFNGAYIVLGLLYGEGDMDRTIITSMRCGADSDCNPSNAAGILATSLGMENLPDKYKAGIDNTTKFSYTAYNFPTLLEVCEKLSREAISLSGGSVKTKANGQEEFIIPIQDPVVGPLQQSWSAGESDGDVYFSDEEMLQIRHKIRKPEDYVSVWDVAGSFSKKGTGAMDLFDVAFGPEIDKNYSGWKKLETGTDTKQTVIDLNGLFKEQNCVAYLRTNIWSEELRKVIFEIGSDDGVKLWVNEKIVHDNNAIRAHLQADDQVEVELKAGWNTVMMKITQGIGGWEASLVVTDSDHLPLKDLRFK